MPQTVPQTFNVGQEVDTEHCLQRLRHVITQLPLKLHVIPISSSQHPQSRLQPGHQLWQTTLRQRQEHGHHEAQVLQAIFAAKLKALAQLYQFAVSEGMLLTRDPRYMT